MRYIDLTLPTIAENLALDEALLMAAETADDGGEVLRFWEPHAPAVVVGRSSQVALEVHSGACTSLGVPIVRRVSGGAAIVAGPGCLMYALVLSVRKRMAIRAIDACHRHVLGTLAKALGTLVPGVDCRGTSDLAIGPRKFSGNSVRARREHVLYHGTLLYDFPLDLIERLLRSPPRQPAYRDGRAHGVFVMNLGIQPETLRSVIAAAWQADEPLESWPREETLRLAEERYGLAAWNEGR